MKKITFLLAFVAIAMFTNAADWVETFGPDDAVKNASSYWPYVAGGAEQYVYTNYDHAADCVYDGCSASVRKVGASATTVGIGNHLWLAKHFPANPPTYPNPTESWFSISGINQICGILSFDLAPNSDGYTPNIKVWINDVEFVLPPISLATTNVMQTVSIPVNGVVNTFKIQNFDITNGFRLDNISLHSPLITQSNILYEIDSINFNKAYVAGASDGITSAAIPNTITHNNKTYPVVEIYPSAFANQYNLASVTIPSSITNIGASAFLNCPKLTSVFIPSSVTSIGSSAFKNTGLTSIVIPTSVTSISEETFSGCSALTSVSIPASVTNIGSSSFLDCVGLTTITIPVNVSNIGSQAFANTGLTSLVYNAANCPTATFSNLSTLNSVIIGSGVLNIPANFISGCSNVTSLNIPESVTSIGFLAFSNCSSLTSIIIPESVTSIGFSAFANCSSLTSIIIPESVTSIAAGAFYNCSSLTSITIPESVTSIGSYAFAYTGITSVTIPASVTSIGSEAFVNSKLFSLIYNAESCENFTARYNPFNGLTTLKVVTIGATVKSIPEFFIFGFSGVTSVTIPEGVTHIGASAFDACNNLTRFICEGNPTIESASSLLIDKSLLDTIAAPASVFAVPEIMWATCPKAIRYVKVTGGELSNDAFSVINRSYKTLNTLDLAAATNTQLADEAFKDCYSLETLLLPSSLERIGYMAVANCKNLKSVHVPASVTDIDDSAFENCRSITSLTFGDQADKSRQRSVQANSQLKRIGNWSFYNCHNLQSLTIPEGVTEIGSAAFYGCTYLQDLTLPGSLQQIGDNCFALCSKLNYINVNATIPPTIESKTFADVNRTIPLYVPAGSLEAYQSDIYWSEFLNVSEAPTAIKPVTIIEGVYAQNGTIVVEKDINLPVAIYDVVGRLVVRGSSLTQYFEVPNAGVYIVKGGEQTMKVLVP